MPVPTSKSAFHHLFCLLSIRPAPLYYPNKVGPIGRHCLSGEIKYSVISSVREEIGKISRGTVSTYTSTRHYNPEDQHRHLHSRENLKFHTVVSYILS
jgi:hypothetical protein